MFNRSGFNHTAFNRPSVSDILMKIIMNGEGGMEPSAVMEFSARLDLSGEGGTVIDLTRIFATRPAEWEGEGSGAFPVGKLLVAKGTWQGIGTIRIENESFQIFFMEFDGTLEPGERITLNTERFTLKKDGEDALPSFVGNFIDLKVGLNEVVIESDSGSYTVLVRVEHRDRWV